MQVTSETQKSQSGIGSAGWKSPAGACDFVEIGSERKVEGALYLREEVDRWAESLRALDGKSESTVSTYRRLVLAMIEDLPENSAFEAGAEITLAVLEEHVKRRYYAGCSPATRALVVAAIRSFCYWAAVRGLLPENPAINLHGPKVRRREKPVLSPEEITRLVYNPGELLPRSPFELRNRTMWWLMYIAALRISEVAGLRLEDVHWYQDERPVVGSILIRDAKHSREDVRRTLDPEGSRLLASYLQRRLEIPGPGVKSSAALFPAVHGGHLSTRVISQYFEKRIGQAKVRLQGRRVTPHVLRHSIATHLLETGWTIKEVQLYMRHASIKSTEGYLHADTSRFGKKLQRQHPVYRRKKKRPSIGKALSALVEDLKE